MNMRPHRMKERRGASAVEFAIVAPFLFMVLIGMIEFGRAMMVQHIVTMSARRCPGIDLAGLDGRFGPHGCQRIHSKFRWAGWREYRRVAGSRNCRGGHANYDERHRTLLGRERNGREVVRRRISAGCLGDHEEGRL